MMLGHYAMTVRGGGRLSVAGGAPAEHPVDLTRDVQKERLNPYARHLAQTPLWALRSRGTRIKTRCAHTVQHVAVAAAASPRAAICRTNAFTHVSSLGL